VRRKQRSCCLTIAALFIFLAPCGCRQEGAPLLSDAAKRDRIEELQNEYRRAVPGVPEVSVPQLLLMLDQEEVVLVDGREERERTVSMIPGAITMEQLELGKHRDQKIIVYCTAGYRSRRQARELRGRGLQAFSLRGGILSWVHAGRKAVNRKGETRRVHVYGPEWNLLPERCEAVW